MFHLVCDLLSEVIHCFRKIAGSGCAFLSGVLDTGGVLLRDNLAHFAIRIVKDYFLSFIDSHMSDAFGERRAEPNSLSEGFLYLLLEPRSMLRPIDKHESRHSLA